MAEITLTEIQPGMEIARDVTTSSGQLLLKQGTILTEKHIQILKTWGIRSIQVGGDDNSAESVYDIPPEILLKSMDETDRLFAHVDTSHPAVVLVKTYCATRRARQMMKEPVT